MPSSRFRAAAALCLVALGALVFAAAPASAEVVHVIQPTTSNSFPFNGLGNPLGVAEDQSAHLIYVSDLSNGTIHKFTAEGKTQNFSALGSSVLTVPSSPSLYQIGVDNSGGGSAGDIYVADSANHRVDKFDPSGELDSTTPYIGEATLSGPTAVAVDGSGNVFVADNAAGVVDEFSSEGALLKTFGSGHIESLLAIAVGPAPEEDVYVGTYNDGLVEFEHSGACVNSCESFDPYQILGLGIDTHGNVFASNTGDAVGEFTSAGTLLEYFGSASEFLGQPGGVAIDSTSEDVYVADAPQSVIKVFKPFPANRLTVSVSGAGTGDVSSNPGSIYCSKPYGGTCTENFKPGSKVTLTAEPNGAVAHSKFAGWSGECSAEHGNQCEVEMTAARSVTANFEKLIFPEAETEASSEVTPTSATLNGKVNPNGKPLTECFFEYGGWGPYGSYFGPVYNHKAECEPAFGSITGTSPVAVKAKASITGPVYFRLVATNENGNSTGSEQVVPIPVAEADTVHEINGEGKTTVFGTLEPSGAETHYHFEFVTEKQFEEANWSEALSTPSQDGGSGTGTDFLEVEAPELQPETGYDFRVAAESEALPGHTVYSPVKTFPKPHALEPAPESCPNETDRYGASARLPDCRAYEQVTPAEKEGAQEAFGFGHGFDPDTSTATDGESFLMTNIVSKWTNNVGSVLETYDFKRTPTGWQIHSLNPQPESKQVNDDLYHMYNNEFSNFLVERQWATSFSNQSPSVEYAMGPAGGPYVKVAEEPNIEGHFGGWRGQSREGNLGVIETADHELIPGHPTKTVGEGYENPDIYAYSPRTGLVQVNVDSNGEPIGTNGTCGAFMVQGREEGERGGDRSAASNGGNSTGGVNSISADGSKIFFYDSPGECATFRGEISTDGMQEGTRANLYMREPFAGKTYDLGHWTFEAANPGGTRLLLGKFGPEGAEYYSYNTETKEAKHAFNTPYQIDDGQWVASSEDGSVIYFENIFPLNRESVVAANLWRYDLNTETLSYVSRVTGTHGGPYGSNFGTTEHGEGYFFQKEVGPSTTEQVYFYDANEQLITCVSCDSPVDPNPVQASFPVETGSGAENNYGPVVTPASANGDYMFFETANALLPNDINGELEPSGFDAPFSPSDDIYEWRRHGLDGCTAPQGCLALITDGIGGGKKELLGVSPSGRDVFFATESQLVAQDKDTVSDVYDARIDGGYPPPPPLPVQCEGDACHNPTNPPNDPTPSSSVYEGPGNEHLAPPTQEAKHHKHQKKHKKHHRRSQRRAAGHGGGK